MPRVVQQVIGAWRVSLRWPGNGAYPARAQASPGLRSLRALPNKSGETAGCQHSYSPSLSLPLSPTPSVCSSHSSSPRFISRSLLSALADSNGKTERRVFHSPAWTQNVERKSGKVGTLADQIAPHRDFICSQEEVKKKKKRKESALRTCRLAWIISAAVARSLGILLYGTR